MKHFIILQNDMDMLDLLLEKYPKDTDGTVFYHFVNDTRAIDRRKEIEEKILKSDSPIKDEFEIHDSKVINNAALKKLQHLSEYGRLFFDNYRYNLQFTIPIFFEEFCDQIVMTDDDVVLYQDASKLFNYKYAFIRVPFNKFDVNKIPQQFYEFLKVFDLNITVKEYNVDTMGAGTFTYTYEKNLLDYFNKFYSNEVLMNIFKEHYDKYENGYKNNGYVAKSFFADKFWNFYFKKIMSIENNKFIYENGEVRLILTRFKGKDAMAKKLNKAPVMIHYASGTNKKDYIPWLKSLQLKEKNGKQILEST